MFFLHWDLWFLIQEEEHTLWEHNQVKASGALLLNQMYTNSVHDGTK